MQEKKAGMVCAAVIFGLCFVAVAVNGFAAEGEDSSSACVKCHTDLDAMDSAGAEAAGGGGAIAG